VRLGDDRQVVIEVARRDPVEVIPVVVRQDREVERRQPIRCARAPTGG